MAHTFPEELTAVSQNETNKQRKKQAKKEAKMMLKVEAAKKDVQKAEQKVAKAQAALEASRTHLHDLEEKLSQMRASSHTSQNGRQTADLKSELQTLGVSGLAAGIVKNGRLVCTAVAGMANIEQNRPVTPDTLFILASVSKTVTATALMQLYDQGRFKLDDDVNKYLPFQVHIPAHPKRPITFRQLLIHTSSIKDNDKIINSLFVQGDSPVALKDFMQGYFMPGGKYYSKRANFHSSRPGTV
jgi:CubicO group peptidase (beta-lactamase class C family)